MAVTRLQRRQKKNRINSTKRQQTVKDLLNHPVIKNVDVEALKAEFEKKTAKKIAASGDKGTPKKVGNIKVKEGN
ncbi:MAG: hypothetical protein LBD32_02265 [Cytophagales bacterium]|jgi:hypothetical protein|nr:hypothetical protein [Cytophagales bacterium]